ncbi:heterokaryon incompatibility protein-domain-containing protein [Fusarium oxysporum]|nr:heterokaryon incompatibility protein-domain-containing protein [Fusarium oxysporum]
MSQYAFKHQPLADPAGQIRLVEVISQPDMPLELSLSVHQITQSPDYYAISYTWGDSRFAKDITINSQSMIVTENCRYALTQVRNRYPSHPGEHIFIWIDSICINQDDNKEKSYQVAVMSDIYTVASKVLACVGPHQDNSQILRNFFDSIVILSPELHFYQERSPLPYHLGDNPLPAIEGFLQLFLQNSPMSTHDFSILLFHAFTAFASRSYWRRVWIIQEVVASTRINGQLEILCGCDGFSRSEIKMCDSICSLICPRLIFDLQGQRSNMGLGLQCCRFVLGSHVLMSIPASILLHRSMPFLCARPEDKVYGLLPLIEWPEGITPVEPIYEPSPILDLAQLFTGLENSYTGLFGLRAVLNGLEVYHDHKLFRLLVEARMRDSPQPIGHGKYPPISFKFEATVTTIFLNSHGQLSANLVRNKYKGLDFMNDIKADLDGLLEEAPEGTRELFSGSRIGALLCSDAREGDKIINLPIFDELLVLRRRPGENEYDIVGQALLLPDHKLQSCILRLSSRGKWEGKLKKSEPYGKGTYVSYCELEAEPIDLIVLERQDRGVDGSQVKEKKWERLATKVYGRVRLTE